MLDARSGWSHHREQNEVLGQQRLSAQSCSHPLVLNWDHCWKKIGLLTVVLVIFLGGKIKICLFNTHRQLKVSQLLSPTDKFQHCGFVMLSTHGFVCLCILARQQWLNQWCEFDGGAVCLVTNGRLECVQELFLQLTIRKELDWQVIWPIRTQRCAAAAIIFLIFYLFFIFDLIF